MRSLRTTLTFWFLGLFSLVLVALAVGSGIHEYRYIIHDEATAMTQVSRLIAEIVENKEGEITNYLSRVAARLPHNPDEAANYLKTLRFPYLPLESTFFLLDDTGKISRVFEPSLEPFVGISLSNLADVRELVKTHKPTISKIHISPFTGRRVVSMNFPSWQGGNLRVDISTGLFLNLIEKAQKTTGKYFLIFDKSGKVYSHPAQAFPGDLAGMGLTASNWKEIRKGTGHPVRFTFNGKRVWGVFTVVKPLGLITGALIPESMVYDKVIQSIMPLVVIGVISLLSLFFIVYWIFLSFVASPLEKIATEVSMFDQGITPIAPSAGRGFGEWAFLIKRFNEMATRIQGQILEIKRLETMLRNILDSSPAIVVALNAEGHIWYLNQAGARLFSVLPEEVKGKTLQEVHAGLLPYEEKAEKVMRTGEPLFFRTEPWVKGTMVDGAIYPLMADGIEGVVIQWLDVSEKYRAREAYRRRLEEIFSHMNDFIYVANSKNRIELVNEKLARYLGEDVIGRPCYEVLRHQESVCPDCRLKEIKKGRVVKQRFLNEEDKRYYDALFIPFVNEDGTLSRLSILRDVTEDTKIQEALKASEAAYRALFEGAPVGMSVHQDGRFVMVNAAMCQIVGYAKEELVGASIFKIIHPDDIDFIIERVKNLTEGGGEAPPAREKYLRKDGSVAEVLVSGMPTSYHGRPAVQTVVVDLSEQARLQLSLLRSEAFSTQILEKALDPILIVKPENYEILDTNLPAPRFFGVPYDEIVGKSYLEFVAAEERDEVRENFKRIEETGSLHVMGRHLRLPSGERLVNLSVVRVKTPEGEDRDVTFIKDLTEFMSLQQRLAQAQKQESLWQMAGGFAHDFNNLLAIMFGYLDMIDLTEKEDRKKEYFRKLREISIRARDLVQNILLFSRENQGERLSFPVPEIVSSVLDLVRPALGSKVDLKVEVCNPQDMIYVDKTQMVQVLLNLMINAKDAIGDDAVGTITLCTRARECTLSEAEPLDIAPGKYVEFSVRDTGPGIPEGIQQRIFDPFFTTKARAVQKGTGLGLAIVNSIVKNFEGHVDFESFSDGTVFRVLIPVSKEDAQFENESRNGEFVGGTGKILVVEDEELLRDLLCEMLGEMGYGTESAGDGLEAVEKVRAAPHGFDMVIMDLAMPRMGGEEALSAMLKIRADLKVVIMSGMVDNATQSRLLGMGAVSFVKKPVMASVLSQTIQQVMNPLDR